MTREALSSVLSDKEPCLPDVWEWYAFQRSLVIDEKNRVVTVLINGEPFRIPRYFGKDRGEVDDLFEYQTIELDRLVMLGLLTTAEAALRVDYLVRVRDRRKDEVSRRFRRIYEDRKLRTQLKEILNVWRDLGPSPQAKNAVGEFKGALKLRDWLSHGRYWRPKLGHEYDPTEVFDICARSLAIVNPPGGAA